MGAKAAIVDALALGAPGTRVRYGATGYAEEGLEPQDATTPSTLRDLLCRTRKRTIRLRLGLGPDGAVSLFRCSVGSRRVITWAERW